MVFIILWLYLEQILVVQVCWYINITLINDIYRYEIYKGTNPSSHIAWNVVTIFFYGDFSDNHNWLFVNNFFSHIIL